MSATVVQASKRARRVDPTMVGRKVLAALDEGRRKAQQNKRERWAQMQMMVVIAANTDRDAGMPDRGRAGRVRVKLGWKISERLVRKYLARLTSRADFFRHNGQQNGGCP